MSCLPSAQPCRGPHGRARCHRGRSRGEEGCSLWGPDKRLFIFLPMLPATRPPRRGEEASDNRWARGSVTGGGLRCDPAATAAPPRRREAGRGRCDGRDMARVALCWLRHPEASAPGASHTTAPVQAGVAGWPWRRVWSPPGMVVGATRDGKGWDGKGRSSVATSKPNTVPQALCAHGEPPAVAWGSILPSPLQGGIHGRKRVPPTSPSSGPPSPSAGASLRTARLQQGCPGQGKWLRQTGIYRIRPSNGCLHSGFPLAAAPGPARSCAAQGGSGWGEAHASAPAEDELYSHFHT